MTDTPHGIRSGIWQTHGGSYIELEVHPDQTLSGFYCSIHGQPQPDEKFPLTGFVNQDLIGFVVSWGEYRSITSWCGLYGQDSGRECIRTVWHLGREFADAGHTIKNDHWETFLNYTGTYYLK